MCVRSMRIEDHTRLRALDLMFVSRYMARRGCPACAALMENPPLLISSTSICVGLRHNAHRKDTVETQE